MLKYLLSFILCLCIFEVSLATATDVESHINTHNRSGIQHSGDKDFDGDGDVEHDGQAVFKPLQFISLLFVRVVTSYQIIITDSFLPISFSYFLLKQQNDPNHFFRPPIAA